MERTIHGVNVIGVNVDSETRCAHYHDENDVIAIKFKCCGDWFSCHQCHSDLIDHAASAWPRAEFDELAVLCGACGRQLSIREYLACDFICPHCGRQFNPGCAKHGDVYFSAKF